MPRPQFMPAMLLDRLQQQPRDRELTGAFVGDADAEALAQRLLASSARSVDRHMHGIRRRLVDVHLDHHLASACCRAAPALVQLGSSRTVLEAAEDGRSRLASTAPDHAEHTLPARRSPQGRGFPPAGRAACSAIAAWSMSPVELLAPVAIPVASPPGSSSCPREPNRIDPSTAPRSSISISPSPMGQEMFFHLGHRVHVDRDDDQARGWCRLGENGMRRWHWETPGGHADHRQIGKCRRGSGSARQMVQVGGRLARAEPLDEAAIPRRLSAVSSGFQRRSRQAKAEEDDQPCRAP